jgi:WD40 repeat protein
MARLSRCPLTLLALTALLAAAPPARPADPLPEGARARLGSARFGHKGVVSWAMPLADGKRLLTMASDRHLHIWDVTTGREERSFEIAPRSGSLFVSISADRKSVAAVGSDDRVIHIWDIETGKETRQFAALPANQAFFYLSWSPDDKSIVSYHHDRTVRVWNVATGKEERQLALVPAVSTANLAGLLVHFMPDGKALAVAEDWSVRVLDPQDGKELRWFGGHTGPIASIGFSPDGKLLATVATDRHARLWDVATGKTVARLPLPVGGGRHLSFDGDGKFLAIGAADRTVRVFEVSSGKEVGKIDTGLLAVRTFNLSRDGKALYLVGTGESVVRVYDVGTGKELFPPDGHNGPVSALAWSPDGKTLATAGLTDRSIILWDVVGKKMLRRLPPLETYTFTHLQFTPDGKRLLSYGTDRTLRTWDVANGKELRSFLCSPLPTPTFTLSRDGRLAAVFGNDHMMRVWDVAEEKELHRQAIKPPAGQNSFWVPLAFAADNRTLLGNVNNERVTMRWDAVTGKELGALNGVRYPGGFEPSTSADGRGFVVNTGIATQLTELATGQTRQTFNSPPPAAGTPRRSGTLAAALSADGRTLATATTDDTLHFWDTGSGKELAARKGLSINTRKLLFSPDGKTLAVANVGPTVTLWDVPGPTAEGRLVVKDVSADKLDDLWKDLGSENAARAWQAILAIESVPKEAVSFVQKQLKPGTALDEKGLAKLIAQLDAEEFQEREDATASLIRAGKAAEGAVKKALDGKPSAEAKQRLEFILTKMSGKLGPDIEEVLQVRGVELLERVGTAEARKVLEELAKGGESRLTQEAKAALGRLEGLQHKARQLLSHLNFTEPKRGRRS